MSLEETGRVIRYHELKKLAIKHNAYIATGHHEIDYLETIFINMIRGTGHKGFQTLPIYNNNIFRPLLKFSYEEIEKASQISNWNIFTDESNEDEKFLRNRIRKNMIPFLLNEGLNPKKLYENFHTEEFAVAHNDPDFKCNSISKISIDSNLILEANLSNLKEILDIHLKVFPLHPLNKNFFQSLATKIKDKKPILLENKEAYFHKKENGNLIIIPKNSSLLKRPKIILKAGKSFILWNEKELELEEGFTLGVYQNGLKILQNKMHKSVSEIFRETNIPVLVRKNIPILFQDAIPIKILFEMYEPSIRSCIGDLK